MKLIKITSIVFSVFLVFLLVSEIVLAGSCETDHRVIYCNRDGNPHKEECHTDNNCDNGAECNWSYCAGEGDDDTDDKICQPNEWNSQTCSRCNSDGMSWGYPGSDYGDEASDPQAWCNCCLRYANDITRCYNHGCGQPQPEPCTKILGISASKYNPQPNENFKCYVNVEKQDYSIHCGIAKNDQWVTGCSWGYWNGNTAVFNCKTPSNQGTYDLIGYNFDCDTQDKVTQINVHVPVQNQPPVANAGSDQTVYEGTHVTLSGSSSYDTDGYIVSYEWKEGSTVLSNSKSFSKVFYLGTHYVNLKVTDNDGATDTDTVIVHVKQKTIQIHDLAIISYNIPSSATTGDVVTFSAVVKNEGNNHETSYVRFYVSGSQKCSRYISLSPSSSVTKTCSWTATQGDHNVRIKVDRVSGETDTSDNEVSRTTHVQSIVDNYEIDVYDVDVSPHSVDSGEDVTISGRVKLVESPSGYHTVTVKWYVDGSQKHTESYSMRENDIKSVSWNFDTSCLSEGTHTAKIKATVDSVSDYDSSQFVVDGRGADIDIGSLKIDPSAICVDRDHTVELSIPVTLEDGDDNTRVTARFYSENGGWDYIDRDERTLDVGQTKTFKVYYHYDAHDLDTGVHDIKVVITAGDDEEIDYENLDILSCNGYEDYDIYVGAISLNPEYPKEDEIFIISAPVRLISARYLPEFVYVKGYIDNHLVYSRNIQYNYLETKTIEFTVDADNYAEGSHTVEVEATVDGVSDKSMRRFTIGDVIIFDDEKEHCLLIDRINVEDVLKEGEPVRVNVRVSSCGLKTEDDVRVKLTAFSKTHYHGPFNIQSGESREISFTVLVPEGSEGTEEINVLAWNSYTKDSWSKSFVVYTGVPLIDIKPEYRVRECKTNKINFDISNVGEVTDTFTIEITGTEWMTGVPQAITLKPDEKKTITAYVSVPCDTEAGLYQFTVSAEGSPKYSVTSSLKVVESFKWPSIAFPTGWLVGIAGILCWLPWVLLIILLLVLAWLLFRKDGKRLFITNSRKKPLFGCGKHGGC